MILWQAAHTGFVRCSSIRSRIVRILPPRFASSLSGGTLVGSGGTRRASRLSSTHLPRTTGDVRSACDVTIRIAALAQQALARFVGQRDAAEVAAVDVRACRSASPAARSGTCSRRSSDRATLRSSRMMLPKNSSVSRWKRLPQVVVEVRETRASSAAGSSGCAGRATGRRNWSTSASAFGSASMRRTCCFSTAGVCSVPCAATRSSSSSGMLLHRKNDSRDASSRSLMR